MRTIQITAADLHVGDFLWRTPASASYTVTSAVSDGTTVEVTGISEANRGLSSGRNWYAAADTVHVVR